MKFKEQIEICEIPAPPFNEEMRGREILKRFKNLGLENASMDSEGNVLGRFIGSGVGPKLVVSAHQDTVFPKGTDTTVEVIGGGGIGGRQHSLEEWFDPSDGYIVVQLAFLMMLGLVGVHGISEPLLKIL